MVNNCLKISKSSEGFYDIIGERHGADAKDLMYGTKPTLEEAIVKGKELIADLGFCMVESEGLLGDDYYIRYKAKPVEGAGKPSYGHEGLEATNKRFNRNIKP